MIGEEPNFKNRVYEGHVARVKRPDGFQYRLYVPHHLVALLKRKYTMTYMRVMEGGLSSDKNMREIESRIPFWEFIDIEFDANAKKFLFTSHYTQKSMFPELFKRLVDSAPVKTIQDEISGKKSARIQKQGWRRRSEYLKEVGAVNVIYTLIDTEKKLIYIGEASKLVKRLKAGHSEIPGWDYYKFNMLPKELGEHRVTIERMAIRDAAALLSNKQDIDSFSISEYKLANRKIDK